MKVESQKYYTDNTTMQKLLFTLILSIPIQTVLSQNLTELKGETFNLRIKTI